MIRALRPSIYVKGGDYSLETLDQEERAALEDIGAEIRLVSLVPGRSTTEVIERMGNKAP